MARGNRRNPNGDQAESSQANGTQNDEERSAAEREAQRIAAENARNAQNPQLGLNAVLTMLAQVLERLPAVVNPGGGAGNPKGNERGPEVNEHEEEFVEEIPVARVPSYLKVMDHMAKLGTKFFSGGSSPIEADDWRSRLERNFESIRCPEAYKKDIAVHYLDGDAHIWWKGASAGLPTPNCSWETFSALFTTKYFPPEAFDRMEAAFLELRQGNKSVRQYELEFNQLKKYAGRELEQEVSQVRRFMRGLRVELRDRLIVRDYETVAKLVEKAAAVEDCLSEKTKLKGGATQTATRAQGQGVGSGQGKRTWGTKNTAAKPNPGRSPCPECGKMHIGECRARSGACHHCGSPSHMIKDCPKLNKDGVTRVCFNCNEPGHFKRDCPKLAMAVEVAGQKRPNDGMQPPAKRPNIQPRLYNTMAIGETSGTSPTRPITGESYHSS